MSDTLSLPPLFDARPLPANEDPVSHAKAAAEEGIASGALFYCERPDQMELALILAPEGSLGEALSVAYVVMLAIGDALGFTLPPQISVLHGWPDRIILNEAQAGAITLVAPDGAELESQPGWLIAGITLDMMGDPTDLNPGENIAQTSLYEEGVADVQVNVIIEAFARHFLSWLHRWESEGLSALGPLWAGRALGYEGPASFPARDGLLEARIKNVLDNGDLEVESTRGLEALPISVILSGTGWSEFKER